MSAARRSRRRALGAVLASGLAVLAVGAGFEWGLHTRTSPARQVVAVGEQLPVAVSPSPADTPPPSTSHPVPMVSWHGPVEELFVHPLVLEPRLAFGRDRLGQGFADYFVTAREFRAMLDSLWRNGWTLVDVHRAAAGTVRVPVGRKPLVLSEDDVNYYRYFDGRGLASRLVVDAGGEVRAEYGGRLTTDDVVPMVDVFVAAHPEFSADGAKGVLALTGYEGLLGEHDLTDPASRERVRALGERLRATGWTFASHTFGHIGLARDSLRVIAADTQRWKSLVGDLLGPVDVLIYPFGSRPTAEGRQLLRDEGYRIQLDIDIRSRTVREQGVVVMSRRHVDGLAFATPRRLAPFFDVSAVRDPERPS
jgi:peptidoglycan/xylan/chitin deacetylase (PgdA/CDA1 family)